MVTDASVHDSGATEGLLEEKDKGEDLYADSAYSGEPQEKIIAGREMNNQVCEKGTRNHPLGKENKKHITVFDIPLGMCRSVENGQVFFPVHPVRDASLTGCRFCMVLLRFTERYIPNGMKSEFTIILNQCLYVVYFACLSSG